MLDRTSRVAFSYVAPVIVLLATGCATPVPNRDGVATRNLNPAVPGPVAGIGIESHDITSMTDQMLRDMLANAALAARPTPPRVIVDARFFVNESSQALNKNLITDRLRVNLNRAAQGRLVFVGRENARMVEEERDLKRNGVTDVGTTGLVKAQAGADYRLSGRIASLDSRNKAGLTQRYNEVTFEMVDLESGVIVWNGIYEFERAAADDVVYR